MFDIVLKPFIKKQKSMQRPKPLLNLTIPSSKQNCLHDQEHLSKTFCKYPGDRKTAIYILLIN